MSSKQTKKSTQKNVTAPTAGSASADSTPVATIRTSRAPKRRQWKNRENAAAATTMTGTASADSTKVAMESTPTVKPTQKRQTESIANATQTVAETDYPVSARTVTTIAQISLATQQERVLGNPMSSPMEMGEFSDPAIISVAEKEEVSPYDRKSIPTPTTEFQTKPIAEWIIKNQVSIILIFDNLVAYNICLIENKNALEKKLPFMRNTANQKMRFAEFIASTKVPKDVTGDKLSDVLGIQASKYHSTCADITNILKHIGAAEDIVERLRIQIFHNANRLAFMDHEIKCNPKFAKRLGEFQDYMTNATRDLFVAEKIFRMEDFEWIPWIPINPATPFTEPTHPDWIETGIFIEESEVDDLYAHEQVCSRFTSGTLFTSEMTDFLAFIRGEFSL